MAFLKATDAFRRADELELNWCRQSIAWCRRSGLVPFFRVISRLGDGALWYGLMAAITLYHPQIGLLFVLTGLTFTLTYKSLKHSLVRERPFITHESITSEAPVLDRYSFPSGHTLHAVGFTVLLAASFPVLALGVLPFTLLVAVSRVVLGLHYPTDVLAGALIGLFLASLALSFWPVLS